MKSLIIYLQTNEEWKKNNKILTGTSLDQPTTYNDIRENYFSLFSSVIFRA